MSNGKIPYSVQRLLGTGEWEQGGEPFEARFARVTDNPADYFFVPHTPDFKPAGRPFAHSDAKRLYLDGVFKRQALQTAGGSIKVGGHAVLALIKFFVRAARNSRATARAWKQYEGRIAQITDRHGPLAYTEYEQSEIDECRAAKKSGEIADREPVAQRLERPK